MFSKGLHRFKRRISAIAGFFVENRSCRMPASIRGIVVFTLHIQQGQSQCQNEQMLAQSLNVLFLQSPNVLFLDWPDVLLGISSCAKLGFGSLRLRSGQRRSASAFGSAPFPFPFPERSRRGAEPKGTQPRAAVLA